MNKKNLVINAGAAVASLVAVILAAVGLFKKVSMGTISLFDSSWSAQGIPSAIASHRTVILALGFAALIVGLIVLAVSSLLAFKAYSGNEMAKADVISYALIASAVLVLVFGIIAIVFNGNLNDPIWIFKNARP